MNRTGLTIALSVAFVVGVICAVDPQLDLDLARISFNSNRQLFGINAQTWVQHARDAARLIVTLLVMPAALALVGKLIWPKRRMLIEGRAALFLIVTLALGPGIITNLILKDHWGRARPIDVQQFNGDYKFTPWWDPRGECPNNCSFVAGEPSGAFWTMAPAALAPLELQPLAFGAALLFGAAVGVLRIGGGGHFFSDVVFAGVFVYLEIWLVYGLIYRWPATALNEDAIESFLIQAGDGLRQGLRRLMDYARPSKVP
ncbi:MAG TPA: phosphatase PAP2 family protein [Xanthobacteraceae bacterium]|jgi:lipid A 4'-phosphatase|nr:phosphatase PAP2 family protein [Xanthobacteraceae bacterium]